MWEVVEQDKKTAPYFETCRMKVPGGWLVRVFQGFCTTPTHTVTFVSDPNHFWEIGTDQP